MEKKTNGLKIPGQLQFFELMKTPIAVNVLMTWWQPCRWTPLEQGEEAQLYTSEMQWPVVHGASCL